MAAAAAVFLSHHPSPFLFFHHHPSPSPQATFDYNWTAAKSNALASNWTVGDLKVKVNATALKQNAAALANVSANNPKNVSLVVVKPALNVTALLDQLDALNLTSAAFVKRNATKDGVKWWIKNGSAPALPIAWKTVVKKTLELP